MKPSPVTIELSSTSDSGCTSYDIQVNDYELMVDLIVQVAVGKSMHVQKIIHGEHNASRILTDRARLSALQYLMATKDTEIHHRDGWLFQVISWITTLNESGTVFSRLPQMRWSQTGLDGFSLVLSDDKKSIDHIIVYEEKATTNPRNQFSSKVLPELIALESGKDDSLIMHETLALEPVVGLVDIQSAAEALISGQGIHYRVSLTSQLISHCTNKQKSGLFKGYDEAVVGTASRRGAATMHHTNIREWFATVSLDCIQRLRDLLGDTNVQ